MIPTVIHVSAVLKLRRQLLPALDYLAKTIEKKGKSLDKHIKTGRTHLMDAMPLRLSQEMGGWATQMRKGINRLHAAEKNMLMLAQGGTAVGTGINTAPALPNYLPADSKKRRVRLSSPTAPFLKA